MTEFEKQMAARLQALEFLVQALIRPAFHQMTPGEATAQIAELERQFSTIRVPEGADPETDLDDVMAMHQDAQFFLSNILRRACPHDFEPKA